MREWTCDVFVCVCLHQLHLDPYIMSYLWFWNDWRVPIAILRHRLGWHLAHDSEQMVCYYVSYFMVIYASYHPRGRKKCKFDQTCINLCTNWAIFGVPVVYSRMPNCILIGVHCHPCRAKKRSPNFDFQNASTNLSLSIDIKTFFELKLFNGDTTSTTLLHESIADKSGTQLFLPPPPSFQQHEKHEKSFYGLIWCYNYHWTEKWIL